MCSLPSSPARRWGRDNAGYLTPWEGRLKRIESQFGSVVSSYFVFLRWVFYLNFLLAAAILGFIILPEVLSGHWGDAGVRKQMMPIEQRTATNIKVMWDFEGIMRWLLDLPGVTIPQVLSSLLRVLREASEVSERLPDTARILRRHDGRILLQVTNYHSSIVTNNFISASLQF